MTDIPRENGSDEQPPTIRDRRRIDPETGTLRDREAASGPPGPGGRPSPDAATWTPDGANGESDGSPAASATDEVAAARAEAAERLDDLRRLQAEYVNYRRRVERDRDVVRENARIDVLKEFLPVLDDIGRARDHGDLTGAFRAVAEAVEAVTAKAGLERYGEAGDEFDPMVHEALMHAYSDDVDRPTATQVLQPGYRVGERILRAARVAVAEPGGDSSAPDTEPDTGPEPGDADVSDSDTGDSDIGDGESSAARESAEEES